MKKITDFDEYQAYIKKSDTAAYDSWKRRKNLASPAFIEKALGLAGEAGEATDKIKKIIRDKNGTATPEDIAELSKELGDILWYTATIARYLDVPLSEVAAGNIKKLNGRIRRGTLHGAGDNR